MARDSDSDDESVDSSIVRRKRAAAQNEEKDGGGSESGSDAGSEDSFELEEKRLKEEEEQRRKAEIEGYQNEIEKLTLLNGDLSRRLRNALNMVESQKTITSNAMRTAEMYRTKLRTASVMLNLEKNKAETFQRKQTKQEEFARFDRGRQKADKMHEDLRLAVIDHKISNVKKEPTKLIKIRKHLDAIEKSQTSQKQLLKYLSVQEKLTDDLASCAQQGDLAACRDLIRKGAVVNTVDSAGYLPLHYACSAGFYDVCKLLLEFGSDCSSYLTGFAPIVIAAKNGHAKVVELLVSFGCSVEDTGAAGTPPIVAASSTNQCETIETLFNLGANLNSSDVEGNSALHVCAKTENSAQAIRMLLMCGADTKLLNVQGFTAITVALNCLNVSAMEALGGRGSVEREPGTEMELTGEGYEEMPALGVDNSASFVDNSASFIENSASFVDNSASFVMPQDSKMDAMPYNESSIISNEDGQ